MFGIMVIAQNDVGGCWKWVRAIIFRGDEENPTEGRQEGWACMDHFRISGGVEGM